MMLRIALTPGNDGSVQQQLPYASRLVVVRDVDRYGRQVAEVILPDGRNLNEEVVRAGLAWWFVRYARRDQVFGNLEAEARAARRGLWADTAPVAPWEFRRNGSRRMADDQADAGTVVRAGAR